MVSVVFFGTHTFAVKILESLLSDKNISVDLVITQPDKPVGREQKLQPSPVKIFAEAHGLKIDQPKSLKSYQVSPFPALGGTPPTGGGPFQLGVVAQYGSIIPKPILESPTHGILNVHTSLLPKYRGASPIQSAIMNGDPETGVTIMQMNEGLDTGPIILQKSLKIGPDDTYAIVDQKLAELGAQALLEAIPAYISGSLQPQTQDEMQVTTCKQLTREDGRINWQKTAQEIYNQYRALTPWPGVWTIWNEQRIKLLKIRPTSQTSKPGLVSVNNDSLIIGSTDGALEIIDLQIEGKKPMDAKTFLNGNKAILHASLV